MNPLLPLPVEPDARPCYPVKLMQNGHFKEWQSSRWDRTSAFRHSGLDNSYTEVIRQRRFEAAAWDHTESPEVRFGEASRERSRTLVIGSVRADAKRVRVSKALYARRRRLA